MEPEYKRLCGKSVPEKEEEEKAGEPDEACVMMELAKMLKKMAEG